MQIIPVQAVPSQSLDVVLGTQVCTVNVYQKSSGLFLDLLVNDAAILTCQLCVNQVLIVRRAYLGFNGDLAFYDTQGDADPGYTGLGTRWLLLYFPPSDLA
jgi:hypothetical protein